MNNTMKFTGKAGLYAAARPSYSTALFDFLYEEAGMTEASIIADIGSGTGIFSQALLERGSTVYSVEPNADMRQTAEIKLNAYAHFHSVNGTAEHTALLVGTADFITVAQAFHWFDAVKFKSECQRILKPNGAVILIWNSRVATSELVQENASIFERYCPSFTGFSEGMEQDDAKIADFFNYDYECRRYEHDLYLDKETFIARNLSASYSLKETDRDYASYIAELESLFHKYAVDGRLTMPNETVAYLGTL
jgi:SAM-dependent methyltransferase